MLLLLCTCPSRNVNRNLSLEKKNFVNMKLSANLSLRVLPTIKNFTQIFSIKVLLLKLVRFMFYCLFLNSSGLLKFSIPTFYLLHQPTTFHVAGFWETVQIGFPMTFTHAQCIDYVTLTVLTVAVLVCIRPIVLHKKNDAKQTLILCTLLDTRFF